MPPNAPIFGQFEQDPRVHFDKTAGKWQYEDEDTGKEYEWTGKAWIPLIEEEEWKAQQAAYSISGVDETTPSNAALARQQRIEAQRKKKTGNTVDTATTLASISSSSTPDVGITNGKSTSKPVQASAPKKTGVWVTNLPPDTTPELLANVFSKAGVLMIGDDGKPRIKMYYDDEGRFKGEALVLYFKEGSVGLAVTLLDDTELELGGGFGNMRVREAEYEKGDAFGKEGKGEGGNGNVEGEKTGGEKRKNLSHEEKLKMSKRIKRMQEKITWHSDSDSDDPLAPSSGAPKPGASRFTRVVVLKGMFSPKDLDEDPGLLLELKEDVREEAETLGEVTNVVLYDKEEEGVMTIKFKDTISAQACVNKMNGRFFDGRRISASLYTGKERFRRSGRGAEEDEEKSERERLEGFAQWLVDGEGEGE
ncbi:hypothetical protein TREMEDRAFT_32917 [Tremella mesenterica DSM 1558]|uniref:uncharacterized protein n=1 Tax=Tremella mesenterica (strain ATCC 24925 / CBS 8224 / DSM 1558 / NBRC 9311 / NRRL Y-6157 / RJB 2259-6 / UBC 559-6) TaxID=578456 RepID=UPI0003F4A01D|nr:uncharacterized protein TREMEDRAFT_32917 [Tremella mesenterica DSM 1558]EIW68105.1 hypothetical protein TREMEDRAFT_32917 [Tremella mesenterica DSM 1558]